MGKCPDTDGQIPLSIPEYTQYAKIKPESVRERETDISDEQILSWLQDKKLAEQGFRALLEKYQERLYWHVRRLVVDHEDANDVIQESLVKVFRKINTFRGRSSLYTWLYRIVTNEALSFLRKQKRKATQSIDDEELLLANQLRADAYFDGDEAQVQLQAAIHRLPEKQRIVFNLRYFDNLSYQDISDILGTSTGALKASYHHAVKKIEQYVTARATS